MNVVPIHSINLSHLLQQRETRPRDLWPLFKATIMSDKPASRTFDLITAVLYFEIQGNCAIAAHPGCLKKWDLTTKKTLWQFHYHFPFKSLQVKNDKVVLEERASSRQNNTSLPIFHILDSKTGRELGHISHIFSRQLHLTRQYIYGFLINPEGQSQVDQWDYTGKWVRTLPILFTNPLHTTFLKSEEAIVATNTERMLFYNLKKNTFFEQQPPSEFISRFFLQDSSLFAFTNEEIYCYDVKTNQLLYHYFIGKTKLYLSVQECPNKDKRMDYERQILCMHAQGDLLYVGDRLQNEFLGPYKGTIWVLNLKEKTCKKMGEHAAAVVSLGQLNDVLISFSQTNINPFTSNPLFTMKFWDLNKPSESIEHLPPSPQFRFCRRKLFSLTNYMRTLVEETYLIPPRSSDACNPSNEELF
ncbi:MAG: hypothetical protein KGJ02_08005 [Verrucomicrobiota bacterium]|nr:hypothetical protein [Verrucomicrobiota bacterium]